MTEVKAGFDYDQLAGEAKSVAQRAAAEIHKRMRRSAEDIRDMGRWLLQAKEALDHGQFGDWLDAEFGWAERTARRFMEVASAFKSANLADLDIAPSALYEIAAPSCPDEAREQLIARAEAGEHITHAEAQEVIQECRQRDADLDGDPRFYDIVDKLQGSVERFIERAPEKFRAALARQLITIGKSILKESDDGQL